jgi:hypothetical protein
MRRAVERGLFMADCRSGRGSGFEKAPAHYLGHRERLRERFRAASSDAVSDYELLELVLFRVLDRRDVKPLAKSLIARFGSFGEVIAAPWPLLAEMDGLGDAHHHRVQGGRSGGPSDRPRRRKTASGAVVMGGCSGVLPDGDGVRRQGAVPYPVPRQAQPAHCRRSPADRHGRSCAGLSARNRQALAGTVGDRSHPRPRRSR